VQWLSGGKIWLRGHEILWGKAGGMSELNCGLVMDLSGVWSCGVFLLGLLGCSIVMGDICVALK